MSSSKINILDPEKEHSGQKLNSVKRCLDNVAETIQGIKEEKSEIYGSLRFDSDTIKEKSGKLTGKGAGHTLNYLAEETDYLDRTHAGFRIELDKIDELNDQAEKINTLPTRKEEQDIIREIVEEYEGKPKKTEIKQEFIGRLKTGKKYVINEEKYFNSEAIDARIKTHPELEKINLTPNKGRSKYVYDIKEEN